MSRTLFKHTLPCSRFMTVLYRVFPPLHPRQIHPHQLARIHSRASLIVRRELLVCGAQNSTRSQDVDGIKATDFFRFRVPVCICYCFITKVRNISGCHFFSSQAASCRCNSCDCVHRARNNLSFSIKHSGDRKKNPSFFICCVSAMFVMCRSVGNISHYMIIGNSRKCVKNTNGI